MNKEEIRDAVAMHITPIAELLEDYKAGKKQHVSTEVLATLGASMGNMIIGGEIAAQLAELNEKMEIVLQHITKDGLPLRK